MHEVSDAIGKLVYEKTEAAVQKGEEIAADERVIELRENIKEKQELFEKEKQERHDKLAADKQAVSARLESEKKELEDKLSRMTKEMSVFQRRILKAFPKMDLHRNRGLIEKIKERLEK